MSNVGGCVWETVKLDTGSYRERERGRECSAGVQSINQAHGSSDAQSCDASTTLLTREKQLVYSLSVKCTNAFVCVCVWWLHRSAFSLFLVSICDVKPGFTKLVGIDNSPL